MMLPARKCFVIPTNRRRQIRPKSHKRPAAVDYDDLPGDEIGGREVGHRSGNIVASSRAMQRDALNVVFVGRLAGKQNRSGRDAVHQNFGSESARQAARQHDRTSLRHTVMRVARPCQQPSQRRQIDNTPAPLALHDWRGCLRAEELRFEVRLHDAIPLLVGEVCELRREKHPGVVHQNVEPSEFLFNSREHFPDLHAPRNVSLNCHGAAATPFRAHRVDFANERFGIRLRSRIIYSDGSALRSETQRDATPDALRCSRNQRDLPFQRFHRHAPLLHNADGHISISRASEHSASGMPPDAMLATERELAYSRETPNGGRMKIDLLAIAPHPDDVELTCGGTMTKMAQAGYRTGILDLTRGEMGSRGTPETRLKEAGRAGKLLGAKGEA